MMKRINVFGLLALALVCIFSACNLDTAPRYTVTFSDPGGGNTFSPVTVEEGQSLGSKMPANLTRDGYYVFYGWFDGSNQYFPDTPIGTNITLTARWSDEIATVSFTFTQTDGSGAVIQPTATIPSVTAVKGLPLGPLAFPVTPRAKGWEFANWKLNNEDFTTTTPVPGDITLTAYWVAKQEYTVTFDSGVGGAPVAPIKVFADECIDEWEVRFPPKFTENTFNPNAFFVAWFDSENREYNGRVPITRDVTIKAKWGMPPYVVNFQTDITSLEGSIDETYGNVDYNPVVREAWDSTPENPKWVIVNETTYDVPYNTNRWRILYRINFTPTDHGFGAFNADFYTRYTIRARFYANRQGAETWPNDPAYKEGQFTPNKPAKAVGYSQDGWLTSLNYQAENDPDPSRSEDGWGQISWCSVANWDGQGASADTMLQRYNLDRKGGTINDTWAPLRDKDRLYPPYLLIQTSDNYIGHIEITEIVFHNGEEEYTLYEGEEPPATGGTD